MLARAGVQDSRPADDGCRFAVDEAGRWSLTRGGDVVLSDAVIRVELAGQPPFVLGELEGVRRMRSGARRGPQTLLHIGRMGPVEVSAIFADGTTPQVTVQVRGLDDARDLVAVHFTDGLRVPQRSVWINGYQSWSGCRMVTLGGATQATGYWQVALLPDGRTAGRQDGMAMAFGEDDGASGEFRFTGRALDAVANFGHRSVGADDPPAHATLTLLPSADPLAALGRDAARRSPSPRAGAVPAGWCSWYELYANVAEDDVLASLDAAQRHFDPRAFRFMQLDDGFQRAAGDWEMNAKFPHGHRWLTDRIKAAGFQAGLWLAPFAVTAASGIPAQHPEWLLLGDDDAPLPMDLQPPWGGQSFALDAAQRAVQDWLRALTRRAVDEWGYDYLKLDFLYYGARGRRPGRGASGHEALRAGLRALREGAGRAFLLGCGAPLQHSLGLFDGMRIGGDVDASWGGIQPGAVAAVQRAHWQGHAWLNDPDALVVREPLTLDEARAWASVVAISGQMTIASDRLDRLPEERIALLQRAMPVAAVRGHALDLVNRAPPQAAAPALMAGERRLVPLPDRWRFAAGDEGSYAHPAFDDSAWETIEVGVPWERAGHPGLDGFAWYRTRFTAPSRPPAGDLTLALGAIDDADETFLNGGRLGRTGVIPPGYRAEWQTFRRYAVPRDLVRWGEENVIAVRVYDGGGDGGMWRLTRENPPAQLLCQARDDWWTIGLVNWDDAPARMRVDLASAGVRGSCAVYDVWQGQRLADTTGVVSLDVAPHASTVLGLRRARRFPCVIGSSRHIVQGAIDIAEERWNPRERLLGGRSVMLDGRPYSLTIALPPGFRAKACEANVACRVTSPARAVRLEFPGARDDITWSVSF
jgi:hypothetical protein